MAKGIKLSNELYPATSDKVLSQAEYIHDSEWEETKKDQQSINKSLLQNIENSEQAAKEYTDSRLKNNLKAGAGLFKDDLDDDSNNIYMGVHNTVYSFLDEDNKNYPGNIYGGKPIRGDINRDNRVNISDVTSLIDILLHGNDGRNPIEPIFLLFDEDDQDQNPITFTFGRAIINEYWIDDNNNRKKQGVSTRGVLGTEFSSTKFRFKFINIPTNNTNNEEDSINVENTVLENHLKILFKKSDSKNDIEQEQDTEPQGTTYKFKLKIDGYYDANQGAMCDITKSVIVDENYYDNSNHYVIEKTIDYIDNEFDLEFTIPSDATEGSKPTNIILINHHNREFSDEELLLEQDTDFTEPPYSINDYTILSSGSNVRLEIPLYDVAINDPSGILRFPWQGGETGTLISINDVTKLIDFIISNNWGEEDYYAYFVNDLFRLADNDGHIIPTCPGLIYQGITSEGSTVYCIAKDYYKTDQVNNLGVLYPLKINEANIDQSSLKEWIQSCVFIDPGKSYRSNAEDDVIDAAVEGYLEKPIFRSEKYVFVLNKYSKQQLYDAYYDIVENENYDTFNNMFFIPSTPSDYTTINVQNIDDIIEVPLYIWNFTLEEDDSTISELSIDNNLNPPIQYTPDFTNQKFIVSIVNSAANVVQLINQKGENINQVIIKNIITKFPQIILRFKLDKSDLSNYRYINEDGGYYTLNDNTFINMFVEDPEMPKDRRIRVQGLGSSLKFKIRNM